MSLELLGRVQRELTLTGSAIHEAILGVAERVNRKAQILRLHWQASALLQQMDQATGDLGLLIANHVSSRTLSKPSPDVLADVVEPALARTELRVRDAKRTLVSIDAQIRDLKLESIHHNLLQLQRDLSLRSAAIERVAIARGAAAVGQRMGDSPHSPSLHIATVLRGPFLLTPADDLIFRADDIVILIGAQADMDEFIPWLTTPRHSKSPASKSA